MFFGYDTLPPQNILLSVLGAGVGLIENHIELLKHLQDEGEAEAAELLEVVEAEKQKAAQDSIDALSYIAENNVTVYEASRLGGIQKDELTDTTSGTRYRVILGSFKDRGNAEKLMAKVNESGDFWAHTLILRSGMIAVAACPSDGIQNAVSGLKELKAHDVCPADAWILKIE